MEPTLSYQPLARKYRPNKFSDLIGQEAVSRALSNSIKISREPAGVIFSGVRGIGKTTTARIYAKALNCMDRQNNEPCGVCQSCVAIAGGYHEDVLEIDGASHNGVDEMRALKETVNYVSHRSRYKVYIIDEVHMLSVSAFNALLKTLEEPPPHVVFIFATTELQKVPQTIVGRCQTFYLKKMTLESTMARVREILTEEKLSFDEDALKIVAREGRGSMRDALTFLDQAIALGEGQLTCESLSQIVSSVSSEQILTLLSALVERNVDDCIKIITSMDGNGWDFSDVVEELARFSRHGFLMQNLESKSIAAAMVGLSDFELASLKLISDSSKNFDLNRIFRLAIACRKDLDSSSLDRFIFENYCIEWCIDPGLPKIDELIQDTSLLVSKKTKDSLNVSNVQQGQQQSKPKSPPQFLNKLKEIDKKPDSPNPPPNSINMESLGLVKASQIHEKKPVKAPFPDSWRELVEYWKKMKPLEARKFEEAYIREYGREKIVIAVRPDGLAAKDLLNGDQLRLIRNSLKTIIEFYGEFIVIALEPDQVAINEESILEKRTRIKEEEEKDILTHAKENQWTKSIVKNFKGRVERISLNDGHNNHV